MPGSSTNRWRPSAECARRLRDHGLVVAAENLLLTLAGTPIGLLAGTLLARWFMASYETEGYRWTLCMLPTREATKTSVGTFDRCPCFRGDSL